MISLDRLTRKLPDIALIAPMRAGKDEFYSILKDLGFPVYRIAFGDSMKAMFHTANPHIPPTPKPIEAYQIFGQHERSQNENIFVNYTMSKLWFERQLDKGHDQHRTYVITDVRQPNEYNAAKEAGFIFVKIEASEETRIQRMIANGETVSKEILNAPTEQYLKSFPAQYTIDNNGTREEFRKQIIELIYQLQSKEENE